MAIIATFVEEMIASLSGRGRSVLEFGAQTLINPGEIRQLFLAQGREVGDRASFDAPAMYKALGYDSYSCIDIDGSPHSLHFDLNFPLPSEFREQYDLVTDFGTTEHCFHISNGFVLAHGCTKPGGHILFALPCGGYFDHGFYAIRPQLLFDIALANKYSISFSKIVNMENRTKMPYSFDNYTANAHHRLIFFVCMQKNSAADFVIPTDGTYSQDIVSSAESGEYSRDEALNEYITIKKQEQELAKCYRGIEDQAEYIRQLRELLEQATQKPARKSLFQRYKEKMFG
ncbi:hypothetical protein dsx2_1048 [Desulfovibrio sp. X2]|uniref:hypothetical protein n=1 Tax=Desulfovibrio sp. X2 TaxID=941449 RepID=UPI00035885AE|nr:hypothetical protein [Desulfovibrio sp. X2]EPR37105.1 hypothetical protein dsx2_1048 [Desulfovibrio sp. X2]